MSYVTMSKNHVNFETRLRAVQAVFGGQPRKEVAQAYGVDRATLCRWINRFRTSGEKGLSRKPGSGRPRKQSDEQTNTKNEMP